MSRLSVARRALLAAAPLLARPALGQGWQPRRPLRVTVPFPGGGSIDLVARVMAPAMQEMLGQPVVVENRPGAGGTVGTRFAARRMPDGHSILCAGLGSLTSPLLVRRPPYDPERDFRAVITLVTLPAMLVARPDFPADDVAGWHQLMLQAPSGRYTYSSAGLGSIHHLAMELYRSMTGVEMTHVSFLGGAPALVEVQAGRIDFCFADIGAAAGAIESGQVKALAVSTPRRAPRFPDIPTIQETILPGFEAASWSALWLPAAAPDSAARRLNAVANAALRDDFAAERLFSAGFDRAGGTEEDAQEHLRFEAARWRGLMRERGISAAR
ncbi:tripartite tricarboxylate transporter substrate-binding protein [Rhodovarius crocodyli]|uniref:tripartite tricarboxylate transporter substrate-binding protein n=1 Tax=Rhodovarius crocodyli TaxID=1979269 RepID=UPI0013E2CDCB|nr:tripartite tricarboxylate transporter substrate-binding protein [Rhodovarius crocodyli]